MSQHPGFIFESTVPPNSGIEYHKLSPTDPRVIRRAPVWVEDPVIFCREATNFYPHWYQESLIRDTNIFISGAWSRQLGKSEAVAQKAIWHAFTHPDADVVIIAPGQRQAKNLYLKCVTAIKQSPLISSSVVGKPKMEETVFANGSRIINLPAGEQGISLRGYTISLLIIDEAAYVPDNVFVAVEQGLSSTGGQEICISTPRGRHNEFYRMFFPAEIDDHFPLDEHGYMVNGKYKVGDYSCHHYDYTVGYNVLKPSGQPQLSEFHIERQRRKLGHWEFLSEYMGQFVEDIDSYFKSQLIDRMFNADFEQPRIIDFENNNYFMGIDIAKTRDFTAIVTGQRHVFNPYNGERLKQPHLQVVDIFYRKGREHGRIEDNYPFIMEKVEQWNPRMIYFDKTSIGERPYEELQTHFQLPIEGVNFSMVEKAKMFGTLNLLMSANAEIEGWKSRIQSYVDGEAVKEFKNLVYEISSTLSKTGRTKIGQNVHIYASTGHDDIPMATALLGRCMSSQIVSAPLATFIDPAITGIAKRQKEIISGNPVSGFGGMDSYRRKYRRDRMNRMWKRF